MKNFILLAILTSCFTCNAQAPKIELYDLVANLLPSTGQTSWEKVRALNPKLKWSKKTVNASSNYNQFAEAVVLIQGKSIDCSGKKICPWRVTISGDKKTITQASVVSGLSYAVMGIDDEHDYTSPKYLFKGRKFEAKFDKDCGIDGTVYELKIQGKVPVWMRIHTEGQEGVSLWIEIFLDKKDAKCL